MCHMMRFFIASLSFCLGMFTTSLTTSSGASEVRDRQFESTVSATPARFCKPFDFHWLELENEQYTSSIRHIEVFMDEKAFSEANLRALFEYLSKANPQPEGLTVVVHTDWSQFQNPSPNCSGWGMSESSEVPRYDHLQAIYWRRPGREYFRYSPDVNVDQTRFKKVVIRKE